MISGIARFCGAFLIFVTFAPAQQSADARQQIDLHTRQAQQDLQNKRPDLAIREFQAILALDPGNLEVRGNLGVLEYFQGQYVDAARDLSATVAAKQDLWKIQALLGMSEKRVGDMSKAQQDLAKAFPQLEDRKLKVQAGLELIEVDYGLNDLGKAAEVVNVLHQL